MKTKTKTKTNSANSKTVQPCGLAEQLKPGGTYIVVLDRGWVYVGKPKVCGDVLRIEASRCIRVWGTTKGLGELRHGPTPRTELDDAGVVLAPMRGVIHLIECLRDW